LPALRRLPDLIEIVIVLLGDHVKLVWWASEQAQLTNGWANAGAK
jgi:hypothetical protein